MDYELIKRTLQTSRDFFEVGVMSFTYKTNPLGDVHLTEEVFQSIVEEDDIAELHSQYYDEYDVLKLEKHGIKFFTLVNKVKRE